MITSLLCMIFAVSIAFALQCEFGMNVGGDIKILMSPYFSGQYAGRTVNVKPSCGNGRNFQIISGTRTVLTLPNCPGGFPSGATVRVTVGGESNVCHRYGLTQEPFQVSLATEWEYATFQQQREAANHAIVLEEQKKREGLQQCQTKNAQNIRENNGRPILDCVAINNDIAAKREAFYKTCTKSQAECVAEADRLFPYQ